MNKFVAIGPEQSNELVSNGFLYYLNEFNTHSVIKGASKLLISSGFVLLSGSPAFADDCVFGV